MAAPDLDRGFDARTVTDADGAINEDLYCLSCGYNLRGLYGDPVRCPECGHLNDLGAVAIPAELIRKALRQMETAPTLCVAFAVLFGSSSTLALAVPWRLVAWFAVLSVVFTCTWVFAKNRVRASFRSQPGWKRILFDFHLATVLCTLSLPMLILLAAIVRAEWWDPPGVVFVGILAVAAPACVWGLRIYYAARRRLGVMQRDAAVAIAHRALHRALRHQP